MVALRFQWLFSVSAQTRLVEGSVDIRGLRPLLALPVAPGWRRLESDVDLALEIERGAAGDDDAVAAQLAEQLAAAP
jgi:hypothetical protein